MYWVISQTPSSSCSLSPSSTFCSSPLLLCSPGPLPPSLSLLCSCQCLHIILICCPDAWKDEEGERDEERDDVGRAWIASTKNTSIPIHLYPCIPLSVPVLFSSSSFPLLFRLLLLFLKVPMRYDMRKEIAALTHTHIHLHTYTHTHKHTHTQEVLSGMRNYGDRMFRWLKIFLPGNFNSWTSLHCTVL
jgi:hypothetical protein